MNRLLRLVAVCAPLLGAVLLIERPIQAQRLFKPRPIIRETRREPYHLPLGHFSPPHVQYPNPWDRPSQPDLPEMPWDRIHIPEPPAGYRDYQEEQRQAAERRAVAIHAIEQQLAVSPHLGLEALLEQRDALRAEDQLALTQQLVATLETEGDDTTDPWQARRTLQHMQERFRQEKLNSESLSEPRALVDRRCLDERLADVAAHLIAEDIQGAARLVEKVLSELTEGKAGVGDGNAAEFGKGGILAGKVIRLKRELETLSQVEAALKGAGLERRARLLQLKTSNAPVAVARSLNDLRELEALRVALAQPGKAPLPTVARIEAILAAVAKAAEGEPAATRFRQDLSARLFLEGRAGEARKVLAGAAPGAQTREHAAALLGDMKAFVLGEGKVSTVAVADAVPAVGPRSPFVVRDLAPDGKARDWKPPTRALPLAGPGPVAAAERFESKLEDRLEAGVRQAPRNSQEQARALARQIQTYLRSAHPPARSGPKSSSKNLADR